MVGQERLRDEYLHRVCEALGTYLESGHPMTVHSDAQRDRLQITFTLGAPDTFHALLEGHAPPGNDGEAPLLKPVVAPRVVHTDGA